MEGGMGLCYDKPIPEVVPPHHPAGGLISHRPRLEISRLHLGRQGDSTRRNNVK